MSNDGEKHRLTPDDPVPPDQLQQFLELEQARQSVANQLLRLEQDKIYLLATAKGLDDQHRRLFQAVLTERGLSPTVKADVDAETGRLTIKEPPEEAM